jgi:hypothetical protein
MSLQFQPPDSKFSRFFDVGELHESPSEKGGATATEEKQQPLQYVILDAVLIRFLELQKRTR